MNSLYIYVRQNTFCQNCFVAHRDRKKVTVAAPSFPLFSLFSPPLLGIYQGLNFVVNKVIKPSLCVQIWENVLHLILKRKRATYFVHEGIKRMKREERKCWKLD